MSNNVIDHICLLVDWNTYEAMRHFTEKLAEAMNRKGIRTTIIDAKRAPLETHMFSFFQNDRPALTCSFNTFEMLPSGKFLWDSLRIPHWAILVDPALYSIRLTRSPLIILSTTDLDDYKKVKEQFDRVFFWPHAIESDIEFDEKQDRPYDVVFFGSCYDYEGIRTYWKQNLPEAQCRVLDFAIDIVLTDNKISLVDALLTAWNAARLEPKEGDFPLLFHFLDKYTRGRDRTELIRSIKDTKVHVFGQLLTENIPHSPGWSHYFGSQSNITLHKPVCFGESLEILKQTKFCLNSSPFFRNGTHERVFAGLACGCATLTSESQYLRETFKDNEDILYYQSKHWHEINDRVNALLADENRRKEIAASGRAKVKQHHTWDNRVDQLKKELPKFLT